jgi:membrane protein DedA with SNARE-associated domain/rhodanese-related sulfurtransferase
MDLVELLTRWGVALVFLSVLLEQGGLPLPAAPVLVSAGALAEIGVLRPELVLLVAFVACFLADQAWFAIGRRHGRRVLATLCRVSLSPDTCVRRTDDLITRHGPAVLLVAKFIPGVSAVAIPTAASMGLPWRRFLLFDTVGCLMWCVGYVAAGMIFSREVTRLLAMMDLVGGWSIVVVLALFALYIGWRLHYRWRLRRLHRLVRISPEEIVALLEEDPGLVIVDARSTLARTEDPRQLPRSILLDDGEAVDLLRDRRDQTIVTFCTCPNEASAAVLAERLIRAGFGRVRVLTGGADALALLSAYATDEP